MSKALKWILGILGILVVVAIVIGAVWVWQNRSQMMVYRQTVQQPNAGGTPRAPNGQNFPFGPRAFRDDRDRSMHGFGLRGPMMGGRFFRFVPFGMGFFFLGGLLRLIVPLGLLALVALLFYQLGKRSVRSAAPVVVQQPVQAETPPDQNPPNTPA